MVINQMYNAEKMKINAIVTETIELLEKRYAVTNEDKIMMIVGKLKSQIHGEMTWLFT